jgi:dihydroorotate dehydrogenase electron transfer subunit
MKHQEVAAIEANRVLRGLYHELRLHAPRIAGGVQPGQFVHLRLPLQEQRLLRRPFSVCDADPVAGSLRIVYKIVGEGTRHLADVPAGERADLLGPLGRGFSVPAPGRPLILVAGGYGCAATYLLARRCPTPPLCLFGARTEADLLLVDEFRALGCEVRIATDDGSLGHGGVVTDLLAVALAEAGAAAPAVAACGPHPMLRAVAATVARAGLDAEVSLDHVMCCGVGACFACVVKQRADNPAGWEYVRTCTDGPVFLASRTVWD